LPSRSKSACNKNSRDQPEADTGRCGKRPRVWSHCGEISVLAKTGQYKFCLKPGSLERMLILPNRLQLMQQISNFERICDIDLRRRIVGGGDGFSTTRWPLLRVAGTD